MSRAVKAALLGAAEAWLGPVQADSERGFARIPVEVLDCFLGQVELVESADLAIAVFLENQQVSFAAPVVDFLVSQAQEGRGAQATLFAPHSVMAGMPFAMDLVRALEDSGIAVTVVDASRLVSRGSAEATSASVLLWDETGFVVSGAAHGEARAGPSWTVSTRDEDCAAVRSTIDTLRAQPHVDPGRDTMELSHSLAEPMVRTAPLARELAHILCSGNQVDVESCDWYHGLWQYLRILNMVSTPTWHSDWYFDRIGRAASGRDRLRILISGAADYSLLAHIAWVLESMDSPPDVDVDVLDRCETPLMLCRWFGRLTGISVQPVQSDIRSHRGSYDLVTSDAFVTRFAPSERIAMLQAWRELLAEGGEIITTVRVEQRADDSGLSGSKDEAAAFASEVGRRAADLQILTNRDPAELAARAESYARRMTSHAFRSSRQLADALRDAGLEVVDSELADVPGELHPSQYVRLVARTAA